MIFFFFNDTATTEIYTLSLHDALPISGDVRLLFSRNGHSETVSGSVDGHALLVAAGRAPNIEDLHLQVAGVDANKQRSEEHTSELQSRQYLVCRLLLEKKKKKLQKSRSEENVIEYPTTYDAV